MLPAGLKNTRRGEGSDLGSQRDRRRAADRRVPREGHRPHRRNGLARLDLTATEQTLIAKIIDDLIDQMDSVADLLLAESVFQVAGGNMDGAGAAMLSMDKQQRPPETRGVDTPHSTRGYTQRVVVAMQSSAVGPWAGVADDDLAAAGRAAVERLARRAAR